MKSYDFGKSPYAVLRFILRHCSVRLSTPHSSVLWERKTATDDRKAVWRTGKLSPYQCAPKGKQFARLASGTFYEAVYFFLILNIL